MNKNERNDLLQASIGITEKHFQKIQYAMEMLELYVPFTAKKVEQLTFEEKGYHDVLVYRFNHLYDLLSGRVFPLFVDATYEQPDGPDFVDKLRLLKQLKIIDFMSQWRSMHILRRYLYHYTFDSVKQAEYLNELYNSIPILVATFERIKKRLAEVK
jgi:hypothetical protein